MAPITRDEVVNDYLFALAILDNLNAVDAVLILTLGQEEVGDSLRLFCQDGEGTQEVAISKVSLLDVRRIYIVSKDL